MQVGDVVNEVCAKCGTSSSVNWVKHSAWSPLAKTSSRSFSSPDHFLRTAANRSAIVKQLGRMVAHLFEFGHRGQHVVALFNPLCVRDLFLRVVDDGLIQELCSVTGWQYCLVFIFSGK